MKKTISELQDLLNILYNVYYTPRNFGNIYPNYFSYQLVLFNHLYRGRLVVDKLSDIEFDSTINEEHKKSEFYSSIFSQGNCTIIDERTISFHYSISETLFCYLAYLLSDDLQVILEFFRSKYVVDKYIGTKIDDKGNYIYPSIIHSDIWDNIRTKLQYPVESFHFLNRIGNYVGFRTNNIMEVQLIKIEALLNSHITNYNFDSFNENLIID